MGRDIVPFDARWVTACSGSAGISASDGSVRMSCDRFGPDGCAYVVDYGAVRDFGQSDPDVKFVGDGNGPLVQIPGTGVIWKICAE